MLRIHTVTSASGAKKYYQASDYYSEGQETIGRPGGKLAGRLGLLEKPDRESFERLCDNLHPVTGEPLTLRTNDNRRVGYDFVFSGPKSFSIVEALAPEAERRRLWKAFDEAVMETMKEDIEPDMQTRVRKDGAFENRTTGNMVYADFDHSTSRPVGDAPPDMHRHKHVLAFNATYDPVENCIKAVEIGNIKRDGEYYSAVFYSRLARKLEAMGYFIDRRGGKEWEIAGVPQSVIDKFSKRTDEVEEEHEQRLASDPDYRAEYKHELGAKTRAKKQKELTPEELRKAWDTQLTRSERKALAAVYRGEIAATPAVTADQAVTFATAHCFEKESLIPERAVVATALLHGLGHLTAEDVRREMDRQGVLTGEIDGRLMATTREARHEEEHMVEFARWGRSTVPPVGVRPGLARGKLDDEQWAAVRGLLGTSDRVAMVDSAAGTGKSTMLSAYDRGMKWAGEKVTYLGTTATSVKVLKQDGLKAETVARFLVDERMQKSAQGGRVVVDESSMLGHKEAYKLFRLAEKLDLSLVFLGDSRQHASVSRGAFMRILQQYGGIEPFRLTGIKRQQDAEYLAAVQELSQGNPVEGFDRLQAKGWVLELGHPEDRGRHIAADYVRAMEDLKAIPERERVLVVSPTHAEARQITKEIRSQLRASGKLGKEDREFTRLVAVDATEAERGLATTYRAHDVIQFHQNAKGHAKGERITVTDPADVPLGLAARFSLYRPEAVLLAQGDVIRFTSTVKTADDEHKLRNGDVHSVADITPGGNLRLDNGWVVAADVGHFRHGYVETSFGAQGRTVQRVLLGMSSESLPAINSEMMYVGSSRARERLKLYTDDSDDVRDAIRRSSLKRAALDLVPPVPHAKPEEQQRDRLREHRERRKRWAFAERRRAVPEAPLARERQPAWAGRPGMGASWASGLGDGGRVHTQTERQTPRPRGREDERGR